MIKKFSVNIRYVVKHTKEILFNVFVKLKKMYNLMIVKK